MFRKKDKLPGPLEVSEDFRKMEIEEKQEKKQERAQRDTPWTAARKVKISKEELEEMIDQDDKRTENSLEDLLRNWTKKLVEEHLKKMLEEGR